MGIKDWFVKKEPVIEEKKQEFSVQLPQLDKEALFEETLEYQQQVASTLGLTDVRVIRAKADAIKAADPFGRLHLAHPDQCCRLRKTIPLQDALRDFDVDVTWLFSGREKSKLFDMEPFGNFKHREGITMVTEAGRMRYRKTAFNLAPATFLRDVNRLDLDPYDLIVCDYEPVIAWAAKARGRETIGIGHQYAFGKNTPLSGDNAVSRLVMNQFASVDIPVGLHWAPFDNTILPPILDLPDINPDATRDHVLVYLPFEDQDATTRWLQGFADKSFIQY